MAFKKKRVGQHFKPHFFFTSISSFRGRISLSKVQMCFGSNHYRSASLSLSLWADLRGLCGYFSVNTGGRGANSSGLRTGIIAVGGRFWWRGSCWWSWRRPGWASATATSWLTSWCAAPVAPTPSSASQSSRRPDAWTGSGSGRE